MTVFHEGMQKTERKSNPILDIICTIDEIGANLEERLNSNFQTLNVKTILNRLRKENKKLD